MNFKSTLWKSIVSIICGVIFGFITWIIQGGGSVCKTGQVPCPLPTIWDLLINVLIFVVIVYVIWSLAQKK